MNSHRPPSISGVILNSLGNHTNDARMTSVHEEEDESSKSTLSVKLKDPRSCNERSDSGFSECSNCSTPSASCVCNLTLLDKNQSIVEEQSSISSNEPESENTESTQPQSDEKTAADESSIASSDHDIQSEISSLEYDDGNKSPCDDNQNIVISIKVPPRHELFQEDEQEDLPSEVARRKLSLESTSQQMPSLKQHEVPSEKLKRSNKVALLMEKFEASDCSSPMSSSQTKSTVTNGGVLKGLSTNQTAFDDVKLFDVAKTSGNYVTNYTSNNSSLVAKSKSPARLVQSQPANISTTFRLSNRVREVTERLSQPKQNTPLGNSTGSSIMRDNSNAFARSKDFWKR